MNKHPHAELMKLYAEDAMTTEHPWRLWEVRQKDIGAWSDLVRHPSWYLGSEYRRKPKVVEIDGVTFPVPITSTFNDSENQEYFTINVTDSGVAAARIKRSSMKVDKFHALLNQGMIFENAEDCKRYIEALTELNKKIISRLDENSQKENSNG